MLSVYRYITPFLIRLSLKYNNPMNNVYSNILYNNYVTLNDKIKTFLYNSDETNELFNMHKQLGSLVTHFFLKSRNKTNLKFVTRSCKMGYKNEKHF